MTRQEILSGLNPEQAAAAGTHYGPVLVLAGAGTGKTRVITFRIACMLADGIPPEQILGMTFTNKAAREMRERLAALVQQEAAEKVTLGTFHSFCIRLLRQYAPKLGFLPGFTVADESDQLGVFKQAAGMCGFDAADFPFGKAFAMMSMWKNHLRTPEEAIKIADTRLEIDSAHVYEKYRDLLEMQNLIDFDDMMLLVYRLFNEHPEVLETCQKRYKFLLVDEYQDTNAAQFALVRMLAGESRNLCVVGDDDQSIYSWRGADVGNILDFPEHFPGAKVIKLEQNYRSSTPILAAANAVISTGIKRHAKKLWSAIPGQEPPKIILVDSSTAEAEFLANLISSRRAARPELRFSDFAVLYRSNQLSRQFEQTFRQLGIPYRLVGGQEFFQRREIKDAVAYLKLLENPRDDQSLLRVLSAPPRGIGPKAVNDLKVRRSAHNQSMCDSLQNPLFLSTLSAKGRSEAGELMQALAAGRQSFREPGNLAAKMIRFLKEVGYTDNLQKIYRDREDTEKRRDNIDEFINAVAQFEQHQGSSVTLSEYLESFALLEENDKVDESGPDTDAVTLSSIHAAKGLEYKVVFLVAMENNIFPHERALAEGGEEEEKRLFYVAITRAKEELYLTRARSRMIRGITRPAQPSRFLPLLPAEVAPRVDPEDLVRPADDDRAKKCFEDAIRMLMDPKS